MFFVSCVSYDIASVHCCLVDALWSPAGKGLASWLSFVISMAMLVCCLI